MKPLEQGPSQGADAWYTYAGTDEDVVLSSQVRLSRNLANFPFTSRMVPSDSSRVQAIVFDAFNHFENADEFHAVDLKHLDQMGTKILEERGVLDGASGENSGIILRSDGRVSCAVNVVDHVRINSFTTGLDLDKVVLLARGVDDSLQKRIQFAASYDFGYLTASLMDSGSGMKLTMCMHLPCLSLLGRIASVSQKFASKGISFTACYGSGTHGSALGWFYQISSNNSSVGTEFDQLASVVSCAKQLVEMERSAREECKKTMLSTVKNIMYRSVALARYSMFVSGRETVDLVGGVKLGKDMDLMTGIDDASLHALLFRLQEGHLEYVLKNGNFNFEKDIASDTVKKVERLRALSLQECFEDIILSI